MDRYYSFNRFLRNKFGCRVQRLSLNAGFGCPNIYGKRNNKGCIFCNNKAFSYYTKSASLPLSEQIEQSMTYARRRYKAKKFIAYFQSFTNTYADLDELENKYSIIRKFKDIIGMSISTRPDCVNKDKIKLIESFTKDYMVWMEYGLQTVHNKSLKYLNRNHTYQDFLKALEITKNKNIFIGVHLILGIPEESRQDVLATAETIAKLPISGVKFHCLHAVKETKLQELYLQDKVSFLSEPEYIDIICDFLERIPEGWVVLRLVSDAAKNYLVTPLWINKKQAVIQNIEKELERRGSYQGMKAGSKPIRASTNM